jgi:hypothetical protein
VKSLRRNHHFGSGKGLELSPSRTQLKSSHQNRAHQSLNQGPEGTLHAHGGPAPALHLFERGFERAFLLETPVLGEDMTADLLDGIVREAREIFLLEVAPVISRLASAHSISWPLAAP